MFFLVEQCKTSSSLNDGFKATGRDKVHLGDWLKISQRRTNPVSPFALSTGSFPAGCVG